MNAEKEEVIPILVDSDDADTVIKTVNPKNSDVVLNVLNPEEGKVIVTMSEKVIDMVNLIPALNIVVETVQEVEKLW